MTVTVYKWINDQCCMKFKRWRLSFEDLGRQLAVCGSTTAVSSLLSFCVAVKILFLWLKKTPVRAHQHSRTSLLHACSCNPYKQLPVTVLMISTKVSILPSYREEVSLQNFRWNNRIGPWSAKRYWTSLVWPQALLMTSIILQRPMIWQQHHVKQVKIVFRVPRTLVLASTGWSDAYLFETSALKGWSCLS